jgi:hypothetical protein
VSLLWSVCVHHGHQNAISVPALFLAPGLGVGHRFGHVAVSRFGKTSVP